MRIALLAFLIAPVARAQSNTGYPAADSAAAARSAWHALAAALEAKDIPGAARAVARAATAWPTQDAYLWGRAVVATYAHDTNGVIAALREYADYGFGRDVRGDARFAPFLAARSSAAILDRIDANRKPLARSRVVATLPDTAFYPEGMDADARTGTYYIASIRHRTIVELKRDGTRREILPRNTKGIGAILGVRIDTARGVLWATTAGLPQMEDFTPADSTIAAILRIRISDGFVERRWDLPPAREGHVLGDVAIGPTGDVFITDSSEPVLYRIRARSDSLEQFRHPLFFSLQGMAPTPDGRAVYVADWSHGLLRVDLNNRGVMRLEDAPRSSSLGCDGIALYRGAIIAVQNGATPRRIMRFTLDASGTRITRAEVIDQNTAVADEPTIGAIVGDEFVYVANSQWDKYGTDGAWIKGTRLAKPVLLAVRLPK